MMWTSGSSGIKIEFWASNLKLPNTAFSNFRVHIHQPPSLSCGKVTANWRSVGTIWGYRQDCGTEITVQRHWPGKSYIEFCCNYLSDYVELFSSQLLAIPTTGGGFYFFAKQRKKKPELIGKILTQVSSNHFYISLLSSETKKTSENTVYFLVQISHDRVD